MSAKGNPKTSEKTTIDSAAQFVAKFHSCIETNCETLIPCFRDFSKVVWNGQKFEGIDAIIGFFKTFPACKIRQASIDIQMLHKTQILSIVNNGSVEFGDFNPRCYTESFLVERNPSDNAFVIRIIQFRLVN